MSVRDENDSNWRFSDSILSFGRFFRSEVPIWVPNVSEIFGFRFKHVFDDRSDASLERQPSVQILLPSDDVLGKRVAWKTYVSRRTAIVDAIMVYLSDEARWGGRWREGRTRGYTTRSYGQYKGTVMRTKRTRLGTVSRPPARAGLKLGWVQWCNH